MRRSLHITLVVSILMSCMLMLQACSDPVSADIEAERELSVNDATGTDPGNYGQDGEAAGVVETIDVTAGTFGIRPEEGDVQVFTVNDDTEYDGIEGLSALQVDDRVVVEYEVQSDGALLALEVSLADDVEDGDDDEGEELVVVCHIPPGNAEGAVTIEVAEASLEDHLAHGDTLGECPEDDGEDG